MKYEWRKQDKKEYIPKEYPEIRKLPSYTYIVIEGEGNPNSKEFQECVESLYALSYGIKMAPKKGILIPNYFDYTVFPLEGVWNLSEEGIHHFKKGKDIKELKDYFTFKVMIRQPDFVTMDLFKAIQVGTHQKKKLNQILSAYLYKSIEHTVCQCLHLGSYDTEPITFEKMEEFTLVNGYNRKHKSHTEIYISDPRKVDLSKLKTTLRFEVEK